jgi:CheY-like chemotaxis protein
MPEFPPAVVLYVEDDRINIVLMQEAFAAIPGWRLHCVETGREALAQLDALQPALALIDMRLPDMNGLELIAALRRLPAGRELRCVALSADNPPEVVKAARAAGFADYWLKPVDTAKLLPALAAGRA